MRRHPLLPLLALAAATASHGAFVPGPNLRELPHGGLTYPYRVHVPASHDAAAPVPLVVDIHGLTSNGLQQSQISGFVGLAEREGFIVTHPTGPENAWYAGVCCGPERDDVGFFRALVAAIAAEATIDRTRVYATGLSNGGAMSHRLACDAADLFAAAAPMAFPLPADPLSACRPSRAMPVLTFMGLTDVLVGYEGGFFASAADTLAYWRDVNGCGTGAPDTVVTTGQSRCETHTQCEGGVATGLCSITARAFGGTLLDGHVLYLNDDLDLAQVAWAFLSRFRLPAESVAREGRLGGRTRTRLGRGRPRRARVAWTFRLGQGTWSATDETGAIFTGSALALDPKGRRLRLTPTGDSGPRLADALRAQVADGSTLALVAGDEAMTARTNRRRTRVKVTLEATVSDPAGGGRVGTHTLRLQGRLRP